jgi:hypothetical protein
MQVHENVYAQQAVEMSGAMPTAGMPAYPLYGLPPLGQTDEMPFYRRPLVCFAAGAAVVGAAWFYFGWWKPKQVKKNEE